MYEISLYQNMMTVAILIISYIIICLIGCRKKNDFIIVTAIFLWHTLFSIIYYLYTLSNTADATHYYINSVAGERSYFYPGTPFVNYFSSILSQGADANYLNTTLQHNLMGSLGLILLYLCLKKYLNDLRWYWKFVLFLPSMSFWTAGLGKDAIAFFSTCLMLYAITSHRKNFLLMIIAFASMFMVRPHIAFIIVVSYILYFIIKAKVHIVFKLFVIPIIGLGVFLSLGFIQQYTGLEETSLDGVGSYIDGRQEVNQSGGSSLDIASMSYPMQMFTYLFRPLPFEASSGVSLISSLENTMLLFLFIFILFKLKFKFQLFVKDKNLWLLSYAFLTCTVLALTTSNLGIAVRQKWMFVPILLYLFIYALHTHRLRNNKAY